MEQIHTVSYDILQQTLTKLPLITNKNYVKPKYPSESLHELSQLLPLLSITFATDLDRWHTIGRILYNVSNGSIDGLDTWIAFSNRSHTFGESSCCHYWMEMKESRESRESRKSKESIERESIHILLHLFKYDTPEVYQQYKHTNGTRRLKRCIIENGTKIRPCDCAEIMYVMYKGEFLYDGTHGWFQWVDSSWIPCPLDNITLRERMESIRELLDEEIKRRSRDEKELLDTMRDIEDKMEHTGEDIKEMEEIKINVKIKEEYRKDIEKVKNKSKELNYKNKVIAECKDLFYDKDGIIASYLESSKNKTESIKNIKVDNSTNNLISTEILFLRYLLTEYKKYYNYEIIELSSSELSSILKKFSKTYKLYDISDHISLIKKLNKLKINGIKTGKRRHASNITEFNTKEYLCL